MPQIIGQGGTISLDSFYRDGANQLVDPVDPEVSIFDALGDNVVLLDVPTRVGLGHYVYEYDVPISAPLGAWEIRWYGIINGGPAEDPDGFTVVPAGYISQTDADDPFVTVADYSAATGVIVTPDSALETRIELALSAACREIRDYLEQVLTPVYGDVVVLDGDGRSTILLPQLPVIAVNSVTINKDLDSELVVTDFVIRPSGVLYRRLGWPWGVSNITVDYDHGFNPMPQNLMNVAIQVARSGISVSPGGLSSESIGGYSYSRSGDAAQGVDAYERALARYTVRRIPVT